MDKKKKLALILFALSFLMMGYGLTYSIFNSNTTVKSTDLALASFVFNSENLNNFQIELKDLRPGKDIEYDFSVTNNFDGKTSDVTILYNMKLRTYHFIPFDLELYSVEDEEETLLVVCSLEEERQDNNEIECFTESSEMKYDEEVLHDYRIKISFDKEYNQEQFSNLVDFIEIEIESWQKLGGSDEKE